MKTALLLLLAWPALSIGGVGLFAAARLSTAATANDRLFLFVGGAALLQLGIMLVLKAMGWIS